MLLPRVEIDPRESESEGSAQPSTVIWLHGLGANGHDFVPLVPELHLPATRFVFPHAPEMPVTLNGGWVMPSWYDIKTLEEGADREDPEDVARASQWVRDLIDHERQRGVPSQRIVLAGFSQGGAMALHVGLRYPEPLAGIMALSTYLLQPSALSAEGSSANRATPILFCHGTQDPVVPISRGQRAAEAVRQWAPEAPVRWESFAMEHAVCPQEVEVIRQWLHERLG